MVCWKPTTLPVAAVAIGNTPSPRSRATLVLHTIGGRLTMNQTRITAATAAEPSARITRMLEIDSSIHVLAGLGARGPRAQDVAELVDRRRMAAGAVGEPHVRRVRRALRRDAVAGAAGDLAGAAGPDRLAAAVAPAGAGRIGALPAAAADQNHLRRRAAVDVPGAGGLGRNLVAAVAWKRPAQAERRGQMPLVGADADRSGRRLAGQVARRCSVVVGAVAPGAAGLAADRQRAVHVRRGGRMTGRARAIAGVRSGRIAVTGSAHRLVAAGPHRLRV